VKLIFLGTAGYHPSNRRHTSCLFLPELGIAFDAGTGFFRVRERLRTPTLDVYLTHAHLDHSVGLTFLYNVLEGGPSEAAVHGAADKLTSIREHLFHPDLFPAMPPISWQPLDGPRQLPDGGRLRYWPQAHPGGSLGYRIDWPGRSFALVTDTRAAADASYLEQIRGVDVLVHECNFRDDQADLAALTGHSCETAVAELAKQAGVGRLVLTHVDPIADEATFPAVERLRGIFREITLAHDLLELEL
jgi:ribonuclease Z